MTAANADLWLPVKPSYEGDLALGIARIIVEEKLTSEINIEAYKKYLSPGFLNGYQLRDVSHRTGLPEEKIKKAAHIISEKTPAIVFGGGSTEAHTNGSFNLRAVYGLNILLGSVGVTGGVLPNPSSEIDDLPASSSGASMKEWEKELSHWRAGNVDTVIIRGVDLAHGLPNFLGVAEAINNVKNVIVFSTFEDDTTELADLVLPDSTFLESWGTDIPEPAPGYPVLSMQQPVVVSNSRGFADVLLEVSEGVIGSTQERMIESTIRILQNTDTGSVRASNSMLYRKGIQQRGGWWNTNYSGNISGSYRESSKTGEVSTFSKTNSLGEGTEFHLIPFVSNSLLNGQLAPTPWAQQNPDPMSTVAWVTWAELNNSEADELNIDEGDILLIKSTSGEIEALAYPHPGVQPGTICIPTGQGNSKKGRYAENRGSNVFAILADKKDSETGALAWAATKVVVQRSGRNKKVAKFEGTVEARPIEPGVPVLVLGPGETADEAITANHHIYQNQFLNNSHADTGISHKDDETKTDH
jgi:anaerobic selenocysteine-containing dehydrogenase